MELTSYLLLSNLSNISSKCVTFLESISVNFDVIAWMLQNILGHLGYGTSL